MCNQCCGRKQGQTRSVRTFNSCHRLGILSTQATWESLRSRERGPRKSPVGCLTENSSDRPLVTSNRRQSLAGDCSRPCTLPEDRLLYPHPNPRSNRSIAAIRPRPLLPRLHERAAGLLGHANIAITRDTALNAKAAALGQNLLHLLVRLVGLAVEAAVVPLPAAPLLLLLPRCVFLGGAAHLVVAGVVAAAVALVARRQLERV